MPNLLKHFQTDTKKLNRKQYNYFNHPFNLFHFRLLFNFIMSHCSYANRETVTHKLINSNTVIWFTQWKHNNNGQYLMQKLKRKAYAFHSPHKLLPFTTSCSTSTHAVSAFSCSSSAVSPPATLQKVTEPFGTVEIDYGFHPCSSIGARSLCRHAAAGRNTSATV